MTSINNQIIYLRDLIRAASLDRLQKREFGGKSPYHGERIWIDTEKCTMASKHDFSRRKSGVVMDGEWDTLQVPLVKLPKIAYCMRHWQDGLSWEEAGAYQYMLELIQQVGRVDGCKNIDQIISRYAKLDNIFLTVRSEKRLRVSQKAKGLAFRECGGIYIHIARDGTPLFGGAGHHRLAIAKALKCSHFPAQLGVVHIDALPKLLELRKSPFNSDL